MATKDRNEAKKTSAAVEEPGGRGRRAAPATSSSATASTVTGENGASPTAATIQERYAKRRYPKGGPSPPIAGGGSLGSEAANQRRPTKVSMTSAASQRRSAPRLDSIPLGRAPPPPAGSGAPLASMSARVIRRDGTRVWMREAISAASRGATLRKTSVFG
jgi:hypothetical protein